MSNQEEQVEYVDMVGVSVVNTAHEGYRRAGFILALGANILPPVNAQQWHALEADPRLSVTVIAANTAGDTARGVANSLLSSEVTGGEVNGHVPPAPYVPTREVLLLGAVMCAELETNPDVFYTKSGSPRLDKWRSLVDDTLTVEEITQALAGGVQP